MTASADMRQRISLNRKSETWNLKFFDGPAVAIVAETEMAGARPLKLALDGGGGAGGGAVAAIARPDVRLAAPLAIGDRPQWFQIEDFRFQMLTIAFLA